MKAAVRASLYPVGSSPQASRDWALIRDESSPLGDKVRGFESRLVQALGKDDAKAWTFDRADTAATRIRGALSGADAAQGTAEPSPSVRQLADRIVLLVLPGAGAHSPSRADVTQPESVAPTALGPASSSLAGAGTAPAPRPRDTKWVEGWSSMLLGPRAWRGVDATQGQMERMHLLQALCIHAVAQGRHRPSVIALVRQVLSTLREWPLPHRVQMAQCLAPLLATRGLTVDEVPELGSSLWAPAALWHDYPLACALKLATPRAPIAAVQADRDTALCTLALGLMKTADLHMPQATVAQRVAMGIGAAAGPRVSYRGGAVDPRGEGFVQAGDFLIDPERHLPGTATAIAVLPEGLRAGLAIAVQPQLALEHPGLTPVQRFECLALAEALGQHVSSMPVLPAVGPAFGFGSPAQEVDAKAWLAAPRERQHAADSDPDSDGEFEADVRRHHDARQDDDTAPTHAAWLRKAQLAGGPYMADAMVRGALESIAGDCGMPLHEVAAATSALARVVGPQRVCVQLAQCYGETQDLQRAAMEQAVARVLHPSAGPVEVPSADES